MKAEREKWSGRVTAKALRFQTGQYELAEEEEICRIILVSGGSFTLVRGGESLLVNPGCVLLGMMQSAESEPESPGMIYLTLILHYVEQECRSEKQDIRPRNETVEQICAYLAANYQQKFSLTDVAARFYLSPYYLSRLFRRVTGQSIVDYINGRRIEAAQRLLESTDLNISAVAEQTGFASAAHFRRVFRETMGTGPLQYRKSHRG